ncbi:MAG: hypothetical protein WEA56_13595 [Balneolaceae bacterium]
MTQLTAVKQSELLQKPIPRIKKIFIAGVGAVGSSLLKQISRAGLHQSLRVIGVCNSKHVEWYEKQPVDFSLRDLQKCEDKNWTSILEKLVSFEPGSVVFVDATGNNEPADLYLDFMNAGIHVVTPSKLANTKEQNYFDALHQTARENDVEFLYETNVGAGLPIIQTIKNLIHSGDEIIEISGILSGTMTYLFSELDKGEQFSKTVIKARTLGYAEPDPRDDLSGEDVARKFMILARVCGIALERSELNVESMIPAPLQKVDATTFLEKLSGFDDEWKEKFEAENKRSHTLRYVGTLKEGKIDVGIKSLPKSSSLGQLKGTNNIIEIKTKRYFDQPLIIQGPGAGKEVTAAGVLGDILKIN